MSIFDEVKAYEKSVCQFLGHRVETSRRHWKADEPREKQRRTGGRRKVCGRNLTSHASRVTAA